jgi:YHS domain-containing protein
MNLARSILAFVLLAAAGGGLAQKAPPIALKGHDPVSYFTAGGPLKGASSINYDFDDTRYLFASAKNKQVFASNPDKYAPQFTGLCTTGLAHGMKIEADPNVYLVRDGKLYVFSNAEGRELVIKDPSLIDKAHGAWKAQ